MSATSEWELPHFITTVILDEKLNDADSFGYQASPSFYAVKFYPYVAPGVDPFFAVVGGIDTLICRPSKAKGKGVEVIRWFKDEDKNAQLNSCAWTKNLENGHPLICVAGLSASIKILDVVTGELVRTYVGHGRDIGDLAVSPISPTILASASEDQSIRLWSLEEEHSKQPCAAILAGKGHRENIITIAFHSSGLYLLSGGLDCIINLWILPDPLPDPVTVGTDKPTLVTYPHFSTSAIHSDYVDCVAFHHDLILSKCAVEGKIVLWRIDGFSSSASSHKHLNPPTTQETAATRSAFGHGYQRLLQFDIPNTDPFYMRFGFFNGAGKHPALAMGNVHSRIFFWDLQQLEPRTYADDPAAMKAIRGRGRGRARGGRGSRGDRGGRGGGEGSSKRGGGSDDGSGAGAGRSHISASHSSRSESSSLPPATALLSGTGIHLPSEHTTAAESSSATNLGSSSGATTAVDQAWKQRHDISDPFSALRAHKEITIPKVDFAVRQVAWSVGGEWMVAVGDYRVMAVFGRWGGEV